MVQIIVESIQNERKGKARKKTGEKGGYSKEKVLVDIQSASYDSIVRNEGGCRQPVHYDS